MSAAAGRTRPSEAQIWAALAEVPDPEMPFINLVELGIVRELSWQGPRLQVTITPTFAACPAYEVMGDDIRTRLAALGVGEVAILVRHSPSWSSEWISPAAREKLKAAGLAPPPRHEGDLLQVLMDPVACPRCGSEQTTLRNSFGTTPCRMIYTCTNCQEPFEMFKPL